MKIAICSDHGGYDLKECLINHLKESKIEVLDFGTYSKDSCDYPRYADAVCKSVLNFESNFGVVICTTGIGMSIAANKHKGIRCALVTNEKQAFLTRSHNDSNVIALGEINQTHEEAIKFLDIFLQAPFSNEEKHVRRINIIKEIEGEN